MIKNKLNTKNYSTIIRLNISKILILIILLVNLSYSQNSNKGEELLKSLLTNLKSKPQEALKIGFQILELPDYEVQDSIRAFAMVEMGFLLDKKGLQAQALSFYLQGLNLLTNIGMRDRCGYLLIDIGNIHFHKKQYKYAAEKYYSAIESFKMQNNSAGIYTAYNNLGLIEQENNNLEKARTFFFDALELSNKYPDIPFLKAHSYAYLGDLYRLMKLNDSAIYYYDKAMEVKITQKGYNLIGLNKQKIAQILLDRGDTTLAISKLKLAEADFMEDYNVFYLIKLHLQLSDIFWNINRKSEALKYLSLALSEAEKHDYISEQITILKKSNEYLSKIGNLSDINKNIVKINNLLEKRYETEVAALLEKIDTQKLIDDYNHKLMIKNLELDRALIIRNGAIISTVFLFIIIWLVIAKFHYKKKYHQQILSKNLERYSQELEIKRLKEEQSNREMVIMATNLQSRNDFLVGLKKQFQENPEPELKEKNSTLKKILNSINDVLNIDQAWKIFEEQFIKIHPDFFKKLTEIYPKITQTELKISAYHKMNLETKEIASLTSLSVRSIQTFRYRMKKKLNIPPEISFQEFINSL